MIHNLQTLLNQDPIQGLFKHARFGIEKESQRVTLDGELATTDHPALLGNRRFHPTIQTDFSETQVEIITPALPSAEEVLAYLGALHEVTLRSMNKDEMLWPLSMPPALPEKEEDIIIAKLDKFEDVLYRRYLAKSYGKRKQMVSGIHFNFEYSPEFICSLFHAQTTFDSLEQFKTDLYLKASRHYMRYRWLITYLFGASPQAEARYFDENIGEGPQDLVRSIRNSEYGYTNHDDVFVSYRSIEQYIHDIECLVERGILSEEKEFYAAVRLRGGEHVSDLKHTGIHYIELRNIDNDPYSPYGIAKETIEFLHLFMMYLVWMKEEDTDYDELLKRGEQYNNQVALEHPLNPTAMKMEGEALLRGMSDMVQAWDDSERWQVLINDQLEKLAQPELTLSGRMAKAYQSGTTNATLARELGRAYYEKAHAKPYQLEGFRDMELSTQLLMFDALQRGFGVEVLDKQDQFLKLTDRRQTPKKIEYVKNANMTSKDSYIVPLIMENKTVTKKLLAQEGFRVPQGAEYQDIDTAMADFARFDGLGIVIKPKSTNYGLGITIFKEGATKAHFKEALAIAFKEDSAVLVEEFLPGTEYRFFVIDNQVKAIMLRVPANVTGDGEKTIEALVAEKNQDPLRGSHHRSPLEWIQLGDIEKLMLAEQGYEISDVLPKGEVVYLRENSNVSTGGDSIDMTDDFDESYKTIAIEAVAALGAKVSGIDLIIPDKTISATRDSHHYGIIEANFNPAMHMHAFPYKGQGRRLTQDVLDLLFEK